MTAIAWPAQQLITLDAPRALAGVAQYGRLDSAAHYRVHGMAVGHSRKTLTGWCAAVGLRGRGGAAFPVAAKLDSLPKRGARAVVVNGTESDPTSRKDRTLLCFAPHLVLDGAVLVAGAVHASAVVVAVHSEAAAASLRAAVAERHDRVDIQVERSADGFVAGEERALLAGLSGAPAVPPGRRVHPSVKGLDGRPTFAANTETFAQLALLSRLEPHSFAAVGLPGEAGTMLLTVGGAVTEIPIGARLDGLLSDVGIDDPQAVLLGGYHGSWIDPRSALPLAVTSGAPLGAGVVAVLDQSTCALGEVTRVVGWLAEQSSGQCGPCFFGLPALAGTLDRVLAGEPGALEMLRRRAGGLPGRGACAHPDGTARFVATAAAALIAEVAAHRGGGCARPVRGQLPLPDDESR